MTVGAADSSWFRWERATARLGDRLTTTPGRMRLAGAAIVVGLLAVAIVGTGVVRSRQRAATAVGRQAEPLLVGAEKLYSSLAGADATETNTFLVPGVEPPARRQAYLNDLATAAAQLTKVAGQAGTSPEVTNALGTINKDLPIYSGLVEAARANNLQGFPVGAAYLSEGSALMRSQILPAAGQLYQVEAERLNHAYDSGQSLLDVAGVVLVSLMALALLFLTQVFVAHRTNRMLNLPMLAASVLTLVLLAWTVVAFSISASALGAARHRGSDPVQLLSSAQILVSRSQVDENLALVARGSDPQYLSDFAAVTSALGSADGSSGLVGQVVKSHDTGSADLVADYRSYLQAHAAVVAAENGSGGGYPHAVALATGNGAGDELPAVSRLNADLTSAIQAAQTAFDAKAAAAQHDLTALEWGVIGLVILAGVSALVGLQQRVNEYR